MDIRLDDTDKQRVRREQRVSEMRRRKRRQRLIRRIIVKIGIPAAVFLAVVFIIITGIKGKKDSAGSEVPIVPSEPAITEPVENIQNTEYMMEQEELASSKEEETVVYSAKSTSNTVQLGGDIISGHGILIERDSDTIVARKGSESRINPASMTKILTLLVAAEQIDNLDDTFTITSEITDYGYVNDCSNTGFEKDETVTIRDMLYGTILPSGADAAVGLATYIAGSQEAFVELMNDKLRELGLSETAHFTNCVGVYDANHYCTTYDMAIIMAATLDNELCREILSTRTYTTSKTTQHPEGITISNWFLRRIEDKDSGGEVLGGKTGYVVQSGNCAASYAKDKNGKEYICVTADANSGWRCIYDHVALYKKFIG